MSLYIERVKWQDDLGEKKKKKPFKIHARKTLSHCLPAIFQCIFWLLNLALLLTSKQDAPGWFTISQSSSKPGFELLLLKFPRKSWLLMPAMKFIQHFAPRHGMCNTHQRNHWQYWHMLAFWEPTWEWMASGIPRLDRHVLGCWSTASECRHSVRACVFMRSIAYSSRPIQRG